MAEDINWVADKGSGDSATADVCTLLEVFLNMFLRSACFTVEDFSQ